MKLSTILYSVLILNILLVSAKHHGRINCRLPAKKGSCDDRIVKWYYDFKNKTCEAFIYSGCDGNTNNFKNKHYCLKYCARKRHGFFGWI
uniref:Kunitz-type serine protease inhibitor n=1 Tax=Centruroides hentzi TaxID=88313 RepID=A0A2I9LP58_9SCOR